MHLFLSIWNLLKDGIAKILFTANIIFVLHYFWTSCCFEFQHWTPFNSSLISCSLIFISTETCYLYGIFCYFNGIFHFASIDSTQRCLWTIKNNTILSRTTKKTVINLLSILYFFLLVACRIKHVCLWSFLMLLLNTHTAIKIWYFVYKQKRNQV